MFPSVIPLSGTDCSRVTHPSAARMSTEVNIPARLACVKHAASVRPEPGSNSDVQSLTSTHRLPPSTRQSTQLPSFRQSVSLIKNLTVDTIVAPFGAPVSSFLYKMTFLCIVFKDRCCRFSAFVFAVLATTLMIIAPPPQTVNPIFASFQLVNSI